MDVPGGRLAGCPGARRLPGQPQGTAAKRNVLKILRCTTQQITALAQELRAPGAAPGSYAGLTVDLQLTGAA